MFFYWLIRFLFGIFARLFFRLKVEGKENLPKEGNFIIAANHASSLDPFIIVSAIPRYIRWTVIYEYYDLWYLNWILKRLSFIRLENNLPKEAFRALLKGDILAVFPEGRRSWDGKLGKARRGIAALARRTSCPIVPVAVNGSFSALPRTRKQLKFYPITVRIGRPLIFPFSAKIKQEYAQIDQENTQRIMQAIGELLY